MKTETIHLEIEQTGQRLDIALSEKFPDISRAQIQDWVKKGLVKDAKTGEVLKGSFKTKIPFGVTVEKPILLPFAPPQAEERTEALDIVYEDDYLLVINKPTGLTVHPGAGQHNGTLVNLLLGHTNGALSDMGSHERPGIVHRLDKDTSGLLVVAKTNAVHVRLAESLQARTMKRIYRALVFHIPNPRDGTIEGMIGRDPRNRQRMALVTQNGKEATTHYTTLKQYGLDFSLVECRLETGRTHQIRVHMASINCPVVADPLYGGRHQRRRKMLIPEVIAAIAALPGQALHAHELIFPHPVTNQEMHFTAPLPAPLQNLLDVLSRV
ncbi:MAG: rluD [Alphaproteobacteria bacterium]|nr:rluD [Alphaproteobacteria bacterium]